jgi:hypothetical protein
MLYPLPAAFRGGRKRVPLFCVVRLPDPSRNVSKKGRGEPQRRDDRVSGFRVIAVTSAIGLCLTGPPAQADEGGLEKFVGRWDVRVQNLQPQKPDLTYIETYEWVLGHRFISAKTERKSDGTEDITIAGYDPQTKGYPFWIFSSTGSYTYLPPASWDAHSRTMEWENPPQWDVSYRVRCIFPDEKTRHCSLIVKDWKGKVLLEQEINAVRRND